ncbi:MAG: SUF system NifU family Fe-S cluster assembly protein [Candidatus Binatia bacterium]
MSGNLRDLYRDVVLEHSKHPRNVRALSDSAGKAEGYNPLCGDQLTVYVDVSADVLAEVAFQGAGCALCLASASLMTERLRGCSRSEAAEVAAAFRALVTTGSQLPSTVDLGELTVFAGAHRFPSRVKCVLLAWQALQAALDGAVAPVSTE